MPRVAVTTPYFDFFPELKAELAAKYPGTKFRTDRRRLDEDELIEFLAGCDAAVIGLDRFTDSVCAASARPEGDLDVLGRRRSHRSRDPQQVRHKMWWAAGINKVSVVGARRLLHGLHRAAAAALLLAAGARRMEGPDRLRHGPARAHRRHPRLRAFGQEVVKLLQPYGVKILACDRVDFSDFYRQWNVEKVEADELWARSDVLTIHLSRNATTIGMYTGEVLDR